MPKKTKHSAKPSRIEEGFKDFGEEICSIFKKFETKKGIRCEHPFGIIGPLFSSVLGIVFLIFLVWVLNFINSFFLSIFVYRLSAFLYVNIGLFFTASLLFSYGDYLCTRYKYYCLASPIVDGFRAVFILWILTSIFIFVGDYTSIAFLSNASRFLYMNLSGVFFLAVAAGYVIGMLRCVKNYENCCKGCTK